jgi:hypothetical protein
MYKVPEPGFMEIRLSRENLGPWTWALGLGTWDLGLGTWDLGQRIEIWLTQLLGIGH